ncbi:hypothetical protein MAR_015698, partial [Mya arenaria]
MTTNECWVDLGSSVFQPGMAYVALSRILPLREALDLPVESTASIAVQVLTCSEIQSYKNRQQEERRFFTVEVADSTASTD